MPGKVDIELELIKPLDIFWILPCGLVSISRIEVITGLLNELLLANQGDDLVVIDGEDGVIPQHLRVLIQKLLDFVELHVRIDEELFLLVLVHVVLMEEWSVIAPDQLLVNLPANLTEKLDNLVSLLLVFLDSYRVDTSEGLPPVHIDPDLLQALLFLHTSLPELVLLFNEVVIEHILRLVSLSILFECQLLFYHTAASEPDSCLTISDKILVTIVVIIS